MQLTPSQTLIIILAIALGTMITRFTPFIIFPEKKQPPKVITYLGKVLPASMMGLLIVYSLRSTNVFGHSHGIPEGLAILVVVLLYKWKNSVFLSIGAGTVLYMFLVQSVFA